MALASHSLDSAPTPKEPAQEPPPEPAASKPSPKPASQPAPKEPVVAQEPPKQVAQEPPKPAAPEPDPEPAAILPNYLKSEFEVLIQQRKDMAGMVGGGPKGDPQTQFEAEDNIKEFINNNQQYKKQLFEMLNEAGLNDIVESIQNPKTKNIDNINPDWKEVDMI